jgi:hypothetical protein
MPSSRSVLIGVLTWKARKSPNWRKNKAAWWIGQDSVIGVEPSAACMGLSEEGEAISVG